ncbi:MULTISPECIES: transposase [Bradyrhizobium]|nr:hypothetical protein XH91_35910 [Bradyrhizobium guangzhouense]QOZ49676.1 hypothetical protein XH89_40350 [Bradyrhizobium sp. CCBAU 53340]QOZ64458.1 hypothetical protein XH86_37790 [Bradyrhizobium guangdongense]QOZ81434.1 hypothetical protein XH83_39275 [Bradyrhizobium sp. CCBAU 53351]RXH05644.1 hypothetical protein EAS54_39050 [Bradyrhizobium guangzhouense]
MQVNVLGAERRRRWSYDEKVRLSRRRLQAGETVCGVARRHGVAHDFQLFERQRQLRLRVNPRTVVGLPQPLPPPARPRWRQI